MRGVPMYVRAPARLLLLVIGAFSPVALCAQDGLRTPVQSLSGVRVLPESTEIRLAREAASPSISRDADVYVFQDGTFKRTVTGSNAFPCMVRPDTQAPSLFPMCFDP